MSTFRIFEIGKSALLAARRTMDVSSHNIANAATPGYSRQSVVLEPIIQRQAQVSGAGVRASQILRARDVFIDAVLRNETSRQSAFSVQKDAMDTIQVLVAEPSENSIRSALEGLWSAWHEVSVDPSSVSARASLVERGKSLADMARHMNGQLLSLETDIQMNMEANVNRVNTLSERVVSLNMEISRAVARQEPVADLLDRRDILLDEITELTGATVSRLDDRTLSVRVSIAGYPVVDGNHMYKIGVAHLSSGTEFRWIDSGGTPVPMDSRAMGGRLGGLLEAKADIVSSFRRALETLVTGIVDDVVNQHSLGWDPSGSLGQPFFVVDPADYLGSIAVNPAIVAAPSLIAASEDPADPLDGANAARIADRLEKTHVQTWTAMVGALGAQGQKIESGYDTQELLVKEIRNRKDSLSGVSIDEEVANLVREQHAFNAASRLITTADEMMETIINRMGLR